jgi:hypothetical protein
MPASIPAALATISAIIGIVGILSWFTDEFRKTYAPPLPGVGPSAYRLLERLRARLFRGSKNVRFTIFAIDPKDPAYVRPIARLGPGRAAADSKVRFRHDEGLAGKAWKEDSLLVVKLGPFKTSEEARQANRRLLNLSDDIAESLSDQQLSARAVVAVPLHVGTAVKGVLCIDCPDEKLLPLDTNDKRTKEFWLELFRATTNLSNRIDFKPEISDRTVDELPNGSHGSLWEVKAA